MTYEVCKPSRVFEADEVLVHHVSGQGKEKAAAFPSLGCA